MTRDRQRARLAAFLYKERTRAELSQAELARRAGVSQSLVSRLERGRHDPDPYTLRQLARAGRDVEGRSRRARAPRR